jgi:hypothetical protein
MDDGSGTLKMTDKVAFRLGTWRLQFTTPLSPTSSATLKAYLYDATGTNELCAPDTSTLALANGGANDC